jgi:hypothetical protein
VRGPSRKDLSTFSTSSRTVEQQKCLATRSKLAVGTLAGVMEDVGSYCPDGSKVQLTYYY